MEEVNAMATLWTAVTSTLTQVLTYMTQILTWVVSEPLVIGFISIGLAGAFIRWARRVLHF